jgi:hypothetical protein
MSPLQHACISFALYLASITLIAMMYHDGQTTWACFSAIVIAALAGFDRWCAERNRQLMHEALDLLDRDIRRRL